MDGPTTAPWGATQTSWWRRVERSRPAGGALARDAFAEWRSDKAPRLGAALAYYRCAFARAAPAGVHRRRGPRLRRRRGAGPGGRASSRASSATGGRARAIQDLLANARKPVRDARHGGRVVTLLRGASGVFGQLQYALNTVWEVRADSRVEGCSPSSGIGSSRSPWCSARVSTARLPRGTGVGVGSRGDARRPQSGFRSGGPAVIAVLVVRRGHHVLFALIFKYLPHASSSGAMSG